MPLVADVTVNGLAAGGTSTVAHGVTNPATGAGLTPQWVLPDRSTPITVTSVDSTNIAFSNPSASAQTAIFRCVYFHSVQEAASNLSARYWRGTAQTSTLLYSMSTAGTAVTGTLAETRMQSGGASIVLPTGLTTGGTVMEIDFAGRVTANAGATTLTTRIRLGNAAFGANAAIMTQGPTDTENTHIFAGRLVLSFLGNVGVGQSLQGQVLQTILAAPPTAMNAVQPLVTTVDTSSALNLDFTGQWSAADANSCVLDVFNVKILKQAA